jgi:hypothetical protein
MAGTTSFEPARLPAGRDNGYSGKERRDIVTTTVAAYRQAMHGFASMTDLDVWYARRGFA